MKGSVSAGSSCSAALNWKPDYSWFGWANEQQSDKLGYVAHIKDIADDTASEFLGFQTKSRVPSQLCLEIQLE